MVKKAGDLQKQLDETINNWKRALADYQNLEKRNREEKEEFIRFANRELIFKLLPVLDTLEKLAEHYKEETVKLTLNQFRDILTKEGLEKIEVLGKDFNPEEMECIEVINSDQDNKVTAETRTGYRLKGKILRVAQVKVSKKQTN